MTETLNFFKSVRQGFVFLLSRADPINNGGLVKLCNLIISSHNMKFLIKKSHVTKWSEICLRKKKINLTNINTTTPRSLISIIPALDYWPMATGLLRKLKLSFLEALFVVPASHTLDGFNLDTVHKLS